MMKRYAKVEDMVGLTMKEVTINRNTDEMLFVTTDGREFKLYHQSDCCESVTIDDVNGDPADLVGLPLSMSEQVSSENEPPPQSDYAPESYTWTFYKFATPKGYVNVKWYGTSNGYYSEGVDFVEL